MNLSALIPAGICLATMAILIACVSVARKSIRRADRRSPLTRGMLRGPGHSLRGRIDDITWDAAALFGVAPLVPLSMYAVFLQRSAIGIDASPYAIMIYAILGLGAVAFCAWRIASLMRAIHRCKLGLEAEIVTAEELNRLMHRGYHVFHDIPGDSRFNVDHVVVGPAGVYAVETKGRMKPVNREDRDGHVVSTDGEALQFPGWREFAPLAQARRNAQWVAKWLSSAVGERIDVKPLLSLPGWFVDRKKSAKVDVLSAGELDKYFQWQRNRVLSDKQILQIVHQLDQRCRDIKSSVGP